MNAIIEQQPTDVATTADMSFGGSMQAFDAMTRMADMLAHSSALPETLTHTKPKDKGGELLPEETRRANAFLIINQARQWDCDPMSLAQGVSLIYGKLMYEGKIIAGIVNARAGLVAPLDYEFSGEGDNLTCKISGRLERDPSNVRSVEVVLYKVRTKNSAWKDDPHSMLTYRGARQWARRHAPSILMGVAEDTTEIRQTISEGLESGENPGLDPGVNEDAHRERLLNAITVKDLDERWSRMDGDSLLDSVRHERLEHLYHQRRSELASKEMRIAYEQDIAAGDFTDEQFVAALGEQIKTDGDLLSTDRDALKKPFGEAVKAAQNTVSV